MNKVRREPCVAGLFYPSNGEQLAEQVTSFLNERQSSASSENVRALIVPHAGYVYSGDVAAAAYATIRNQEYENVFVIGASHHHHFEEAALFDGSGYKTPLGEIEINSDLSKELCEGNELLEFHNEIHLEEHSLEVQLPFLQIALEPGFKMVPILLGTSGFRMSKKLAKLLMPYFTSNNLFVFSTDFSHYPSSVDARREDSITADLILKGERQTLEQRILKSNKSNVDGLLTYLCGWSAVLTLMHLIKGDQSLTIEHLMYQNSGDKLRKNTHEVVGYHALKVTEKVKDIFVDEEKQRQLLALAYWTLRDRFGNEEGEEPEVELGESKQAGVFVSFYYQNDLRGCIGRFGGGQSLIQQINELTVESALFDNRFESLLESELNEARIEISLLSPLIAIENIQEIEVGKHGIYIQKGEKKGTFLPQVGARNDWTVEEFLGHCARDKAKIGWDGWRDAQIFIYEALLIRDKE